MPTRLPHLVANVFVAIGLSSILILLCWFGTFMYDAMLTLDRINEVVDLMKYEVSINNGFLPEHCELEGTTYNYTRDDDYYKPNLQQNTWLCTVKTIGEENPYDYSWANSANNQKIIAIGGLKDNINNLYQYLLLEAIANSDVFYNACITQIEGIPVGVVPRCAYSYSDIPLEDIESTTVNPDTDNANQYIVGNRGDWAKITIKLTITRSRLMTLTGLRGEDTNVDSVNGGGTRDIYMTVTVPCLKYLTGTRLLALT